MKYKGFRIEFPKNRAKEKREMFSNLEQQIKEHENVPSPDFSENHIESKLDFERKLNEKNKRRHTKVQNHYFQTKWQV